jgi:GxxExxY protein
VIENKISYKIRGAIFKVYNYLGPGLLESIYQEALIYELKDMGLSTQSEVPLPVNYKGHDLRCGYRIDLLVCSKVLIELKSVEAIKDIHHKQVLTYLRLSKLKLGILVNFNTTDIKQ